MTLPILIFQLWPQYRALQLMITLWKNRELKNQRKFHEKLDEFNKDVSSLGKKSFAKNLRHYSALQNVFNTISEVLHK